MKLTLKKIMAPVIAGLMLFVTTPLNAYAETQDVFNYEVSNSQATIVKCDQAAVGKLMIPDTLGGYPVTSIEGSAFNYCDGLTSITVPASVKSIGDGAFQGPIPLKSIYVDAGNTAFASEDGVLFNKSKTKLIRYPAGKTGSSYTIPNRVTSIGNGAFVFCSALRNVVIHESVTSIGDEAFSYCDELTSIIIPNSVVSIGCRAFVDCTGLTSITIPNSVKRIGYSLVTGATNLTSINVNKANKVYASENGVLFNHSKKELIRYPEGKTGAYTIPNSVKSIGDWAFSGCVGLTSITIPNSVTSIGDSAFYGCNALTSITIPNSVTSIGDSALTSTVWYDNQPDGLIYAGKVVYDYKGDIPDNTVIVLKPGTKGIAGGAFDPKASEETNPGLIGVSIPNTVTNIGYRAFCSCTGLKNVTIPKSVVSIGEQAFGYYLGLDYAEKISGLTISCFAESAGLKYAKENGFVYKILPASAIITDPAVTTKDPTAAVTDLTATAKNVTTTVNGSTGSSTDSAANSNGISNRVTVPAVILTMVALLAVAATAVLIIAKKRKK